MQAQRVGRFTLLRKVDADPRSLLFEARDDEGRPIALRTFTPSLDAQGALPADCRFEDVATLCRLIQHPGLCHVIEHGTDPELGPWFARPWISGRPLHEARPLSEADAVQLVQNLADGLALVHSFGIAHGQVDPRHVVLRGGDPGRAQLTDLGVSLVMARRADTLSATLLDFETPGLGLDPRADLEGLARLAHGLTAVPSAVIAEAFAAAQSTPSPWHTLIERLEAAPTSTAVRAPRPRGHSLLVEDLGAPPNDAAQAEPDATSSLLSGLDAEARFEDRYALAGEIARGGMGAILEAKDLRLGRNLAVKVLLNPERAPAELVARFIQEAQVQGQLEHPNICPVHDLGLDALGQPYFVMKRVNGRALSELIQQGQLPLARLLEIFIKVCDAVAFAHDRGVIHRDLKPDNVMVGEFGEVQVMDWGIAKTLSPEPGAGREFVRAPSQDLLPSPLTQVGHAMGTPHFMPPEQARGDADLDHRADIYALGGILYQILTRLRPVQGRSLPELLLAVMHNQVQAPSLRAPDRSIPKDLESVCLKALSGRREDRYASVPALAQEISAYLAGHTVASAQYSRAERLAKWYGRNRTFARMAMATLLVACIGAGAFLVQRVQTRAQTQALAERLLGEAHEKLGSGAWLEAQHAFREAKAKFEALDLDPGRADFGLWQSRARVPTPSLVHTETGTVSTLNFLDDLRYATTRGHQVQIRDTLTGEVLHSLTTGGPLIEMTRVSPDGHRLAVRVKGNGFVIWDTLRGVRLRGVPAHHVADFRLLSSQRLAYLSTEGELLVIALSNPGEPLMRAPTLAVGELHVSADGQLLITSGNSLVELFRADDLTRLGRQVTSVFSTSVAPAPSGASLFMGTVTGAVVEMQLALVPDQIVTGLEGPLHTVHRHAVRQTQLSRDGQVLLTQDEAGRVLIWDAKTMTPTRELATDGASVVSLSPSGTFALLNQHGQTQVVPLKSDPTRRVLSKAGGGFGASEAQFIGEGQVIGLTSQVGLQYLWSWNLEAFGLHGPPPQPLPSYEGLMPRLSAKAYGLDPRGEHLLTSDEGQVELQSTQTSEAKVALPTLPGRVIGQAVAPGGRWVVMESSESVGPRVIEVATGSVSAARPGHMLLQPAFSPDGDLTVFRLAAVDPKSGRRGVIVWSLSKSVQVQAVAAHDKFVRAAAFSPDARRLFTAGHDGRLFVVEVGTEQAPTELFHADVGLSHVVVSSDGQWLVAASDAGELFVLRAMTGALMGAISLADRAPLSVAFSPKAPLLLVLGRDRQLTLLDLGDPPPLASEADPWRRAEGLITAGLDRLGCALAGRGEVPAVLHNPVPLFACAAHWEDLERQRTLVDRAQTQDALQPVFAQIMHQALPKAGAEQDLLGRTPLHWAAFRGDLAEVQRLLEAGADPRRPRQDGQTPLFAAVLGGSVPVVNALVAAGADLNDAGAPALDAAIYAGNLSMTRHLLRLGADSRRTSSVLGHAVGLAAMTENLELTKLLLARRDVQGELLGQLVSMTVSMKVRPEILQAIIDAGASVDDDLLGTPPLMAAVNEHSQALTVALVDAGAGLNPVARGGKVPLHTAIKNGDVEIAATLLSAGADPDRTNPAGETPLMLAVQRGDRRLVQALLDAGADPNHLDARGRHPALTALLAHQPALMVQLIDHGAALTTQDASGHSLLRLAVQRGDLLAVQSLVARGAQDTPGPDGPTALQEAQRLQQPAMARALQHAQP